MKRLLTATLSWLLAAHVCAQATPCDSMQACERAIQRGAYASARAGLAPLSRGRQGSAAVLALAQLDLLTGHYRDGSQRLRPLLRAGGATRIAASTLLGELELASGHLDPAQRAFSAVGDEPTAHRARVLLGRLLIRRGRSSEAQQPLMALIQAYNDGSIDPHDAEGLCYVAMAAAMLGSARDANDAFLESTRVDPRRVETQLEWAELFLSHYDPGHAEESVQAALEVNPRSARAHALLARVALVQSHDFLSAEASLERALSTNPNLPEAHVLRAGISIRDMDLGAAAAHLDAALAIDSNHLEALSVRAVLPFLRGDEAAYRAARQEVLDRNPHYSQLYTTISEYAEWEHRYAQIVALAREAIRIAPNDADAHATLGINLLRLGQEEEGLGALRDAWARDHYNVRVFNLLELWDHTITPHYQQVTDGPFVFRMHEDERAVLAPTLSAVLGGAFDDMRRRYGFTPQTPVHIELFSDREHFSVRTVGLPNAGVQGVCFGRVVTALSPHAGAFNWAEITWHELAHVFHLQLSGNRVPRWFTEGLAEYETMLARPEWRREEDHRLYLALVAGRLPPVSRLNHAFTHARTADAITVAYYASS
ncbi:MAG TPA: hypothetical protein ENK57_06820, partial [Polyangiaceae bacterium]|nr:hypothetical protein [Polyangiaceae bacterium]